MYTPTSASLLIYSSILVWFSFMSALALSRWSDDVTADTVAGTPIRVKI